MGTSYLKGVVIVLAIIAIGGLSYKLFGNTNAGLVSFTSTQAPNVSKIGSSAIFEGTANYPATGNFSITFYTINGTKEVWNFSNSTYNDYLNKPKFTPVLYLNDAATGQEFSTYDYSGLVTPSLFSSDIGGLTQGRTASQFVSEVFNFRQQLTVYSLVFGNVSEYPIVILASGQGDCKDFAVLMASMLEAGNMQANYGMKIQFLYLDYPNVTDPKTVNHLILKVTYKNGTSQFIETTGSVENPYTSVNGWYFNLTCNSTSCRPFASCPYGEILGSDGRCHAECGSSGSYCGSGSSCYNNHCITCPAGYTIGSDGACHAACGNLSTYCGSGSSCYNGKCVACPSGDILGTDGVCHASCGTIGYCSSGSYCSNDRCISCPGGYSIGSNGECYANRENQSVIVQIKENQ